MRDEDELGEPLRRECSPRYEAVRDALGSGRRTGEQGGHRRTVYTTENIREFQPPKTAADLRDLLACSIVEVRGGKLDPKLANSISYLGAGFLRALEISDLERRLQVLERSQKAEHANSGQGRIP